MTDVIAQLREAYNNSSQGEWPKSTSTFERIHKCDCDYCQEKLRDRDFASLAHNKMPQVLAVLEEAAMLAEIDDYEGPRVATWDDFRAVLSALKGGSDGS